MKNVSQKLILLAIIPLLMGCPKRKQNIPPVADSELESTVDVTFATLAISDIDMICGFIGEVVEDDPEFYKASPVANSGSVSAINDISGKYLFMGFNQTKCVDGMMRDGTVTMDYANVDPNARYYRSFNFEGRVTLSEYKVNGWLIKTKDGVPCTVKNLLPVYNFNPATTPISWSIQGSFEFTHPTDPSRNLTWNGKIIKTLANTTDPNVYARSGQTAIQWPLAIVKYEGIVTGVTNGNVPYTLELNKANPLTRDFNCSPEKIGGVISSSPLTTWEKEFHPFISGIASFTTGTKYPRQIYYGNEGNNLASQCNNSGEVLIKGISYKVDF